MTVVFLKDTSKKSTHSQRRAINTALLNSSELSIGRTHKKQPEWFVGLDKGDSSLSRSHVRINVEEWKIMDASKYGTELNGEKMPPKEWVPLKAQRAVNKIHLGVKETHVEVTMHESFSVVVLPKNDKPALSAKKMLRKLKNLFTDTINVCDVSEMDARKASTADFSHFVVEDASDLKTADLLAGLLLGMQFVTMDWFQQLSANESAHILDWPEEEQYTIEWVHTRWSKKTSLNKFSLQPSENRRQILSGMMFVLMSEDDMLRRSLEMGGATVLHAKSTIDKDYFEEIKGAVLVATETTSSDILQLHKECRFTSFSPETVLKAVLSASTDCLQPEYEPFFIERSDIEEVEQLPQSSKLAPETKKKPQVSFSDSESDDTDTAKELESPSRKRKRSPARQSPKSNGSSLRVSSEQIKSNRSPKRARTAEESDDDGRDHMIKNNDAGAMAYTSALEIEYTDLTQGDDADEVKIGLYYDALDAGNTQKSDQVQFNAKKFRKVTPGGDSQKEEMADDNDSEEDDMQDMDVVDLEPFDDFGVKSVKVADGETSATDLKASTTADDDDTSDDDLMAAAAMAESVKKTRRGSRRQQ
eukprot:CAMPEP_0117444852 /NCGR_PEP_ID=MMETSP0759-20121206/5473_1 /TAXON_ID=63605 /ORGANISM="Percolomonas cosmopolitus, Strain WS" /LENGTH=587 /DNA_ID=CAMNT_0005236969 /DNA_START=220 /DNA_END=1983 /DNA_ORIENTATION=-